MARRLLSHLLVFVAVTVMTATFFIWTVDARVLNAQTLSGELRKSGVSKELTLLIPSIAADGSKDDATAEEIEDMKKKISSAVTAEYVDTKILEISTVVLSFAKTGSPEPTIDLSDFPQRLRDSGVETGSDIDDKFSKPITLNEDGQLDGIRQAYETFSFFKYLGVGLFAAIMLIEWFLIEKGKKLRRVSRVFLYAGLSYLLYYVLLVGAPSRISQALKQKLPADATVDASGLIDAALSAVQGLFGSYFLGFAIMSLMIALLLYGIRYFLHGDVGSDSATSPPPKVAKSTKAR